MKFPGTTGLTFLFVVFLWYVARDVLLDITISLHTNDDNGG